MEIRDKNEIVYKVHTSYSIKYVYYILSPQVVENDTKFIHKTDDGEYDLMSQKNYQILF